MKLSRNPHFGLIPWNDFGRLEHRLREMFEAPTEGWNGSWLPATEIEELATEFLVTMELPGVKQEDVDVEFQDGVLTIRGEKSEVTERKEPQLLAWERSYGKFQRSFVLPTPVDTDNIKAELKEGILKVNLPKTQTARGKKISLQSG